MRDVIKSLLVAATVAILVVGVAATVTLHTSATAVPNEIGRLAVPVPTGASLAEREKNLSRGSDRAPNVSDKALQERSKLLDEQRRAAQQEAEDQLRRIIERDGYDPRTAETPREIGQQMAANLYGWTGSQWTCYDNLIMSESRWVVTATNPSSGAYGIPQSLPGHKMASEGADWRTNPATQIKWGLKYVQQRYGTACSAWSFKQANNWY